MPKERREGLVDAYADLMKQELEENVTKGDWRHMSLAEAAGEIRYHFEKLEMAMEMKDREGIIEFAADVGNQCMILLDIYGYIEAADKTPPKPPPPKYQSYNYS